MHITGYERTYLNQIGCLNDVDFEERALCQFVFV